MANEMRDRLVEILGDEGCTKPIPCNICEYKDFYNCHNYARADRLIESGVIVPPCKVGDVVYCIATVNDALYPTFSWGCCEKYRIVKCTCKSIDIHLPINPIDTEYNPQIYCTDKTEDHKGTDFHFLLKPNDFGTRAFLTKAEAEQKLKEMRGECYENCCR